jgi:hypothetical protein
LFDFFAQAHAHAHNVTERYEPDNDAVLIFKHPQSENSGYHEHACEHHIL